VCTAKSWGGNEKWTSMAMNALQDKHEIYFIGKSEALLYKFNNAQSSAILPFHSYGDWYTYRHLKAFIRNKNIDLIISTKKKEYFLCGIISRQLGIKHLIRLGANRKMNIPFWHSLNYKTLNDGLIVNSNFIANKLKTYSFFKDHPIHVINNGIPGFTSMSVLPERNLKKDRFVIVSSGRITKLKGFQLLIKAVAMLPDDIKDKIEIRIIGEGRNKDDFIELSKQLGTGDIIHFTGFSDQPEKLMLDANLFVLLSEREGLSNSILEAITMGIPVLSTDTGGIKELIINGETGYLVEREIKAITNKLIELVQTKGGNKQIAQNAFDLLQQNFAYDLFEENISHLIEQK
jgi:glycosyltransferase involved in cell wall biosynthesis